MGAKVVILNSNKFSLFILAVLILISGCAPAQVKEKAKQTLNGSCYELFTETGLYSYQICANPINPLVKLKCAFALSIETDGSQFCGKAISWELNDPYCLKDCEPTWEQIEATALARCDAEKKSRNISNTNSCKIFARSNEIIWNEGQGADIKFQ